MLATAAYRELSSAVTLAANMSVGHNRLIWTAVLALFDETQATLSALTVIFLGYYIWHPPKFHMFDPNTNHA
jgi:hypothetical protein